MSGLLGAVVQGAAFGTGSSLAHRAVDGVMGPRTVEHVHHDVEGAGNAAVQQQQQFAAAGNNSPVCKYELQDFNQCMSDNNNNLNQCKFFMDQLSQCQSGSGSWQ